MNINLTTSNLNSSLNKYNNSLLIKNRKLNRKKFLSNFNLNIDNINNHNNFNNIRSKTPINYSKNNNNTKSIEDYIEENKKLNYKLNLYQKQIKMLKKENNEMENEILKLNENIQKLNLFFIKNNNNINNNNNITENKINIEKIIETSLIIELKQKYRQSLFEIEKLNYENLLLKKDIKYTKINELKIINENLLDHINKLKIKINKILNSFELNKFNKETFNNIKNENIKKDFIIINLKEKNKNLNDKLIKKMQECNEIKNKNNKILFEKNNITLKSNFYSKIIDELTIRFNKNENLLNNNSNQRMKKNKSFNIIRNTFKIKNNICNLNTNNNNKNDKNDKNDLIKNLKDYFIKNNIKDYKTFIKNINIKTNNNKIKLDQFYSFLKKNKINGILNKEFIIDNKYVNIQKLNKLILNDDYNNSQNKSEKILKSFISTDNFVNNEKDDNNYNFDNFNE